MSAPDLFDAVQQSKDIKQELKALKYLEEHLLRKDKPNEEQNAIDEDYLHSVSLGGTCTPEKFFNQQETLNRFVCYVFVRRFGWSEVSNGFSSGHSITDPEHKSQINELLGNILRWFHDNEASSEVLTSLIYTLKQAQSKPVVRSQTVIHIMDLLRQAGPDIQSSVFDAAKSAIILSLTDVWSPIRSACISRLGYVIEHFTIQQLRVFFNDLIEICRNTASTWQAIEGAVMGINTVIRKFQWIGILPDSDVSEVPSEDTEETVKCEFILKFGTSEFSAMPEFISIPLEDVIYKLLANTQLSIRENAIKCYSAYLGRCELKVAVRTLTELVSKLNPADADVKNKALFFRQFMFLGDFEAEGLLGVCVHLVKQIPSQHLLPLWTDCSPVFSMYLGHTACTVRQVSSTIFKFIVAKNSSSPDVLKSVLNDLCHQWIIDMAFLSHDHSSVHYTSATSAPYSGIQSRITLKKWLAGKRDGTKLAQVWEWREGRLLAYELIMQFLIKNHWLYTFGSANLGPLSSPQDTEELQTSDNMANPGDRLSSRGSGRMLYHSMKAGHGSPRYESYRRSSCSSPVLDVCIERPRTSSESIHASSQPVDVPTKHCHHNVHCSHHRLGSSSTGGSLGSTHEVRLGGRMPTVYGCGASSIKSYGRHYSYYTNSEEGDKTSTSQHSHTACSLLALCLDTEKQRKLDGGDESGKKTMLLSDVLRNILLQCIESVADARWELRRMGQQLLPCVVEVMRWYDAAEVEDFINKNLQPSTSLLSYGACICLMHSLMHVARLQQLLQEPPSSWQDVHLCQQLIHSVISCIRHGLHGWLKIVLRLLQRPVVDHLTVVSMETVMISVGNFDFNYKEKCMMTKCVLERLTQIYTYYHPKEELSDCFKLNESNQVLKISTEGFLSCRAGASTGSTTPQFEKYLLTQIHPVLNQFTDAAPINEVATLLPLATAWFGLYMEDDTLFRHLMECIYCLCNRISLHCDNNEDIDNRVIESHCTLAFQQIIKLILDKSIDHQSVRQVLDLCLAFLTILSPDQVVRRVLHAVASRLMSESKPNSATLSHASGNDKDLYLQSNDVNISGTQIEESLPSDEDDHIDFLSDGPMPETQMLNVSGNSGHSVSSHQRSRCNSGDDHQEAAPSDSDSSDWDDWDNEEEDISGLQTAVCEFLTKLQSKLTSIKQETLLHHQLEQCTDEERSILQNLIK